MATSLLHLGPLRLRWRWPVALLVLLVTGTLLWLGCWQLGRAADKLAEQEAYVQAGNAEALPLHQLHIAGLPYDLEQHRNRRVIMEGRYLDTQHLFLIYQTFEEQLGFEVLTAFQLEDGRIVLVSRGWSPARDTTQLAAQLQALPGQRRVQGQLQVPTLREASRSNPSRNTDWPLVRRYVNMAELAPFFQAPLFPYVVRLAPGEPGLLVRHWPEAVVATDRHYSYALQWFAMAIAVVVVTLLLASNLRELLTRSPPAP